MKLRQKRGITLIALIITIIVLLILAGVTISMVVGDNGVLKQAQNAKIKTEKADLEEALGRAVASAEGEYATSPEFNNGSETFYEWLKGDSSRLKESGYTITLKSKSDGLQGTITKEDKNNGLKFTLKGGEARLDVDVDITGEYNKGEGKTAADLGPEDIGKVVKYSGYEADYDGEWEIFYTDEENIYLITKGCVDRRASYSSVSSEYNGTKDFEIEERLNDFPAIKAGWLSKIYLDGVVKRSFDDRVKCIYQTERLLDRNSWKKFEVEGLVEYVIGSPTLELLAASYDFYHGDTRARDLIDEYKPTTSPYPIYPSVFYDEFVLEEGTVYNHGFDYMLASPYQCTKSTMDYMLGVSQAGAQRSIDFANYRSTEGIRPVVVLNKGIQLKLDNETFKIVE